MQVLDAVVWSPATVAKACFKSSVLPWYSLTLPRVGE